MTDHDCWTIGCASPPPGSFGLSRIGGTLGKLISAGQAFSGDASRFTHAFVVLDNDEVLEAMPGGARIVPIADRLNHAEVVFCDAPVQEWMAEFRDARQREIREKEMPPYTDEEAFLAYIEGSKREEIVDIARGLEGVGYGYLQYLALGLVSLGFEWKWLERYIAKRSSMICSQLVDDVYRRVGIRLFDDHRLPQQVTPGDLAIRFGIA